MEGDVLSGLMRWQVSVWIIGALLGGFALAVRALFARFVREIDERMGGIDRLTQEVSRVDAELKKLVAELPLHYQRREDAIREYTAMNAKLDRIYELMMELRKHG